jgi:uncharacterized Zn finger protein
MVKQMKPDVCPACGSKRYEYVEQGKYYKCHKCGFIWDESFDIKVRIPHRPVIAGMPDKEDRSVYNEEEEVGADEEEDGIVGEDLFGEDW